MREDHRMKAADVMTSPAITVGPQTRIKEVAALLVERAISAVPVVEQNGDLIGIVSEADLYGTGSNPDPRSQITPAEPAGPPPISAQEVMTQEVVTSAPDADVAWIARLMLEHGVKRIPIVDGRRVVGIVSRRDLLTILARKDDDIRREVQDLLDSQSSVLGRCSAEVSDGLVTIAGIEGERIRIMAARIATEIPGVLSVRFL